MKRKDYFLFFWSLYSQTSYHAALEFPKGSSYEEGPDIWKGLDVVQGVTITMPDVAGQRPLDVVCIGGWSPKRLAYHTTPMRNNGLMGASWEGYRSYPPLHSPAVKWKFPNIRGIDPK